MPKPTFKTLKNQCYYHVVDYAGSEAYWYVSNKVENSSSIAIYTHYYDSFEGMWMDFECCTGAPDDGLFTMASGVYELRSDELPDDIPLYKRREVEKLPKLVWRNGCLTLVDVPLRGDETFEPPWDK